jgi:hypothetical protein
VLVEATAEVYNRNALDTAFAGYVAEMDREYGRGYQKEEALRELSRHCRATTVEVFETVRAAVGVGGEGVGGGGFVACCPGCSRPRHQPPPPPPPPPPPARRASSAQMANFGGPAVVSRFRSELEARLADREAEYLARNKERNPTQGSDVVLLVVGTALCAWALKFLIDMVCAPWSTVCQRTSQFLGLVYMVVFLTGAVLVYRTGGKALSRFSAILTAVTGVTVTLPSMPAPAAPAAAPLPSSTNPSATAHRGGPAAHATGVSLASDGGDVRRRGAASASAATGPL